MSLISNWLARARMLLGCGLCAFAMYQLVWFIHSVDSWGAANKSGAIGLLFFAPVSTFVWSALPRSRNPTEIYTKVRHAILLHAVLTFLLVLVLNIATGLEKIDWLILAIIGIFVDLTLVGLGPWIVEDFSTIQFYRKSILISNGCLVIALLTWSCANIGLVAWNAEKIAAERPYCLQVSRNRFGGYRQVGSLFDLSGLAMQAPSKDHLHFSFHSVLVIQSDSGFDWYNWSYRRSQFMPISEEDLASGVIGMSEPDCKLQLNFVSSLPAIKF
ncbi:hypothetical protein DC522_00890 [Microvirga sp. KLBC 81]|uniref:hypothetical protein n=1 Tax=Microvirga sp. KLBC 81 TaxID=1862707 RepID=UPI000D520E85|nr:hypothetical protein [Microvirga sp. KLBC 81]PVE26348.1 hypothetical protein DC522_00890 [Microvirga sp. KLBC 81]